MYRMISAVNEYIFAPAIPAILIIFGLYLGIKLRFFNVTKVGTITRCLLSSEEKKDRISSIRAVTLALAGTLGVGNITGVASAIVSGGPGSIFWMWIGAFFSMLIKYCEIVVSMKYRVINGNSFTGGAMYYMKRYIAVPFSVLCICAAFAIGNFLQMNAVTESIGTISDINPIYVGIIIAFIVWLSISREIKCISSVTFIIVPLMSIIYIMLSLAVIIDHIEIIPQIFKLIFRSAFNTKAFLGGAGGYTISKSIRYGISRGIISNEAGCGTAPMAHATSTTKSPVKQGFWGIFEVFADTVIMCSLTAFVILCSIDKHINLSGMELVTESFAETIGSSSGVIITVCILMFAIATMIGWSYYGITALKYLSTKKAYINAYILLYCLSTVIASVMSAELMWKISDFSIGCMTVLNIAALLNHTDEVRTETEKFFGKIKQLKRAQK